MWTNDKKVELIGYVVDIHESNANDEDGDKHMSDAVLAMEAIGAILADVLPAESGALRMFLQAPVTTADPKVIP